LQTANGALLRGFKGMFAKHQRAAAAQAEAQAVNAGLAAELAQVREALAASERAKEAAQYHLRFMHAGHAISA